MKMVLFYTHKKHLLALALLACLIGLFTFRLSTAGAEDKDDHSASADAPDGNDPNLSETASAPATTDSSDPNTPSSEDEDDIFELNPSSLALVREAYRNIFTPELVSDKGLVKYSTLKRKRYDVLDATRELKKLSPAVLMRLSKEERIAFWINTYNFCTIELILRYYPIQPKWWNILYPDNSIMQITGAWEKEFFWIQNQQYNLQEIEQGYLLTRYEDPRICFALSNASIGGATLRNKSYKAECLDEQLNDQVKQYLTSTKGIQLDKDNQVLKLSTLFQKYTETFLASEYAEIKRFRNHKAEERAWLNFIQPYLSQEDIRYLETTPFKIKFIEVDWHLNEAQ